MILLIHPRGLMLHAMLCLSVAFACACHTSHVRRTPGDLKTIPVPSDGPVLVVIPPQVPGFWRAEDIYKRVHQILTTLHHDGWIVIAPWDFQAQRLTHPTQLFERSEVVKTLKQLNIPPGRCWVLAATFRERVASQRIVDRKGKEFKPGRAHQRDVDLVLELYDPRLKRLLGRVEVTARQDPTAESANVVDTLPVFTELIPEVTHALVDVLRDQGIALNLQPVDFGDAQFTHNPRRLETYQQPGFPALRQRLASFPPLEQTARKVIHYQFFDPTIDAAQIRRFSEQPPGMLVRQPGTLSSLGLKAGDYLVEVDGVALDGRHALARLLQLPAPEKGRVITIIRDGAPMTRQLNEE